MNDATAHRIVKYISCVHCVYIYIIIYIYYYIYIYIIIYIYMQGSFWFQDDYQNTICTSNFIPTIKSTSDRCAASRCWSSAALQIARPHHWASLTATVATLCTSPPLHHTAWDPSNALPKLIAPSAPSSCIRTMAPSPLQRSLAHCENSDVDWLGRFTALNNYIDSDMYVY